MPTVQNHYGDPFDSPFSFPYRGFATEPCGDGFLRLTARLPYSVSDSGSFVTAPMTFETLQTFLQDYWRNPIQAYRDYFHALERHGPDIILGKPWRYAGDRDAEDIFALGYTQAKSKASGGTKLTGLSLSDLGLG